MAEFANKATRKFQQNILEKAEVVYLVYNNITDFFFCFNCEHT